MEVHKSTIVPKKTLAAPPPEGAAPAKKAVPNGAPHPEKAYDAVFAELPRQERGSAKTPPLVIDTELVSDLVNRRVAARTNERRDEHRRTQAILEATDREIAEAAETARQQQAELAQLLTDRAYQTGVIGRAAMEADKAAEAGVAPSRVVALPSTAPVRVVARRSARIGVDAQILEARLAKKLDEAAPRTL